MVVTAYRVIGATDFRRLRALTRAARHRWLYGAYVNALERELRRADLVPPPLVPGDVVTMNSIVRVRDARAGTPDTLTVVYPHRARGGGNRVVSVLAPLGTAIIGRRAGDVVRTQTADGFGHVSVERVLYQPEAAGDFHL